MSKIESFIEKNSNKIFVIIFIIFAFILLYKLGIVPKRNTCR